MTSSNPTRLVFFLCLYILIFFSNFVISQTYISPLLGYDFQSVDPLPHYPFELAKEGYSFHGPIIGFKIKQKLFGPFYFRYTGEYTQKKIHGYLYGGVLYDLHYRYNYFRNNLSIIYLWNNKLYAGIGPSFNIVNNLNIEDVENQMNLTAVQNVISERGLMFSTGFKYKKYDMEFYYYIRKNKYSEILYYDFLHKVYSLGFRLSYDFKILNGIKKKKALECPDFKK
jgi:hypothetical protein